MRFAFAFALLASALPVFGQEFTSQVVKGLTEDPSSLKGKVTAVIFVSAQCPVSNAYGDRLEAIYKEYAPKGVRFLFVNSNVTESESYIAENAKQHGFTFEIYHDQASRIAEKFGAQVTPETYVIDKGGAIRYHGAVDDSQNEARVHSKPLRAALDAVLAGQAPPSAETKAFGCTIKRPRKSASE
jgi:thiol-disulfide isomerase/thioredoxin